MMSSENRRAALIAAAAVTTNGTWGTRRSAMLEYADDLYAILEMVEHADQDGQPVSFQTAGDRVKRR